MTVVSVKVEGCSGAGEEEDGRESAFSVVAE